MSVAVGDWDWDAATARLTLKPNAESALQDLAGTWHLTDLARVLEGLSAKQLERTFSGSLEAVSCELRRANGQTLSLIGGIGAAGAVTGVVLADADGVSAPGLVDEPPRALMPAYQPIFDVTGQRIAGFEALARWEGDERSALDHLNDSSLAPNMLIQAVDALIYWRGRTGRTDLYVQVNVTAQDLSDAGLPDLIAALITGHALEDGALRLELTEHAALRDSTQVVATASRLREQGVRLVLDDFGSGHSSFLWLAHLPADAVKIDSALIAEIHNLRVQAILSSITQLAETLGLLSVAEGVEEKTMLPVLQELGFTHVQGFGLARPVSREAGLDLLRVSTGV